MHEEDSSSQNANISITGVSGQGGKKLKITLSDGTIVSLLKELAEKENITADTAIDAARFHQIKELSDLMEAESCALSLISNVQHSALSLERKLIKRRFSKSCIRSVLAKLAELGYLDDDEFAKAWISSRISRHPEGRSALAAGLAKQGISRAKAEKAIRETITEEIEEELARQLLERLTFLGKPEEKIIATLKSRGFSYPIIRKLRIFGSDEEASK